jgi:hypothetical protein
MNQVFLMKKGCAGNAVGEGGLWADNATHPSKQKATHFLIAKRS